MNVNQSGIGRMVGMLCLAALIVGCETVWPLRTQTDDGQTLSHPPGPGLVASQASKIADVPIPVGFLAVASRSNSYVPPSGPRVVNHTYQGIATVTDATRFYRQQLPSHGWQFIRERSDGSITSMVYVKGQEELTVQVSHPRVLDILVMIRDRNATGAAAVKP
jgi:hypothetical protein